MLISIVEYISKLATTFIMSKPNASEQAAVALGIAAAADAAG